MHQPRFTRYIGIDYSGAATAGTNLTGIRVYLAARSGEPCEIPPPPTSPRRKNWSRRDLAQWLADTLKNGPASLVGIDHGFSFPTAYFEQTGLPADWDAFLDDFTHHWPTHEPQVSVDDIRNGILGNAAARMGSSRWRRIAESCCGAKSVFHFDVQGSVAKSTHSGIPWLRKMRSQSHGNLHFWPFDGWLPPKGKSVICEIYPSLHSQRYPCTGRNPHQQDAWTTAMWLREIDQAGIITDFLDPVMPADLKITARLEGWILGVAPPTPAPYGCK